MWKKELGSTSNRMYQFLNRYPEFSTAIYEMLSCFKVFLLPLDCDRRTRQRIEASIANGFYAQSGIAGKFQELDIKYTQKRIDEEPVQVLINSDFEIAGLPNNA